MVDTSYLPTVYMKQGGAEMVLASGGRISAESGSIIQIQSGALLTAGTSTAAASTIADPSGGSTSTGGTVTTGGLDTKARASIVSIITALDNVGITATS